jgi:hypothetical protein
VDVVAVDVDAVHSCCTFWVLADVLVPVRRDQT